MPQPPRLDAPIREPKTRAPEHRLRSFRMEADGGEATVYLYDVIDAYFGLGAADFRRQLDDLGEVDTITLRINSPGGSVFQAAAMYTLLRDHPARIEVKVDGLAASAASLVMMAGDDIQISEVGMVMVHDPVLIVLGTARQLREEADLLDKLAKPIKRVYAARTGNSLARIEELMEAETWMDAEEAVELGFASETFAGSDPEQISEMSAGRRLTALMTACRFGGPFDPPNPTSAMTKANTQPTQPQNEPQPAEPQSAAPPAQPQQPQQPAQQPQQPAASSNEPPATLAQLREACEGADNDFLVAQLEAEATLSTAQKAWMAELKRRLDAQTTQQPAAANKPRRGVDPLPEGPAATGEGSDDPIVAWNEAVAAKMRAGMKKRQAIRAVLAEDPELHEAYLTAWNEQNRRPSRG